jgi:hypothetical protein
MIRSRCPTHALLLALGVLVATSAAAQQPPASEPGKAPTPAAPAPAALSLEPNAIEILKASGSRLAAARTMSFRAVVSYESPSRLGPPLVYTRRSEVTVQRPDKLRVITPGDGRASEFLAPESPPPVRPGPRSSWAGSMRRCRPAASRPKCKA